MGHAESQSDCRKIFDDDSHETARSTETSHMTSFGNFIALNGDFGHAYVIGRVVHPLIIIIPLINFQHPKHKSDIYSYYNRTFFNLADKAGETNIISFLEYQLPLDIKISEDIRYQSSSKFSEKFEKNSRCTTN